MTLGWRITIWLGLLVAGLAALWLLAPVLLPFLLGLAIAYLLDPPVRRLEGWGCGRTLATSIVIGVFFVIVAGAIALLAPVLQQQTVGLVGRLIDLAQDLVAWARPYIDRMVQEAGGQPARDNAGDIAGKAIGWAGGILAGLWSGGVALVNIISLLFVTPIVAFYMLRDWPRVVERVDGWLPLEHADTIRTQAGLIDDSLSGFIRGQALVCLVLGVFYAVALTLAGLNYGLVVGLLSGVLTFIPYAGAVIGLVISVAIALFQFDGWVSTAIVAGIFLFGQFVEGNFLSPKLVGDRVGLHPVWLILALMAGGALFGFAGMLVAVPVAAAMGVLLRFALARYLASALYRGPRPPLPGAAAPPKPPAEPRG